MIFPETAAMVDANWVSYALARNFPGTVVTKLAHGIVINGTATKIQLLLEYNEAGKAHGLPPALWYKGGLEAHSGDAQMLAVYAAEAAFYRDIAPRLDLQLPRCFFVNVDEASGRSALLLEDLLARNAGFGSVLRPASVKLAASVLGQLAILHGRFWNDVALRAAPYLKNGAAQLTAFLNDYNFAPANWARSLSLPRGRFVTGALAERDVIAPLILRMLKEDAAQGHCLVHGDAHLGNVFILPGEQAGYLDWQTIMFTHWAHDIGYFLACALTIEDRRAHERDLVLHYAAQLRDAGGTLDDATAWWEYRRHLLYSFCWFPCAPEWQPEAIISANTERSVAAILDLDTLACWGIA